MYASLLTLGAGIIAAGLGLIVSGVSFQPARVDASNDTPGIVATTGGCILVGLAFVVCALFAGRAHTDIAAYYAPGVGGWLACTRRASLGAGQAEGGASGRYRPGGRFIQMVRSRPSCRAVRSALDRLPSCVITLNRTADVWRAWADATERSQDLVR